MESSASRVPSAELGSQKSRPVQRPMAAKPTAKRVNQNRPEKQIWHDSPEKRMPRNGAEAKREEHAKLKTKVRSEAEWT